MSEIDAELMQGILYKEARELILQGKKVARNLDKRTYVYFKGGQLVREERGTRGKVQIKGVYKNGIRDLDEIFKGNEENPSYKFVEVE
jgi:hypothetical protein